MIGIIAEKPSQARNFAQALFGSTDMQGYYKGEEVAIVALRGHLYELSKEGLPSWDLGNYPWDARKVIWKFELRKDDAPKGKRKGSTNKAIVANAVNVLKGCDEVVIACDNDPETHEGSGLACEVIFNNDIRPKKFTRMYFVDESAREVTKAFEGRVRLPSDLATWAEWRVAYFRNRYDYLIGLQSTRIASRLAGGYDYTLQNGRLKSAMIVVVGDQLKAIAEYKKVPFYQNRFRDDHGVMYVNPEEPRFKSRDEVPGAYHVSSVTVDSKKTMRTAPPRLLDLAAISSALAPKNISAAMVLSTYQRMYEAQVVTYPRTEDKTVTPEQFRDFERIADKVARVVGVDPRLLTHREPRSTHVKPQGAHGANRPGSKVPASLSDLAQYGPGAAEIYELVARSALSMLAGDYVYERQCGHVTDYPKFVGSVDVPRENGWHEVLGRELVDEDADENAQGLGTRTEPFVFEGFPKRPQAPTMKWLMKQLERYSVGTGATRTSTYSQITAPDRPNDKTKRQIMIDKRGKISMAPAGELSYKLLGGTTIGQLQFTEGVFKQMRQIEEGSLDVEQTLDGVADVVRHDLAVMERNAEAFDIRAKAFAATQDVERASGTYRGKKVSFKRVWGANDRWEGHRFTDAEVERLLAGETIEFPAVSKKGSDYTATGSLKNYTFKGRKCFGFSLKPFS